MKRLSFQARCLAENKPELLALYDSRKSPKPAEEIPFSSGKPCVCSCPDCGYSWPDEPNKLSRRTATTVNYKIPGKRTYCPYCKGKRLSYFYNLTIQGREIIPFAALFSGGNGFGNRMGIKWPFLGCFIGFLRLFNIHGNIHH